VTAEPCQCEIHQAQRELAALDEQMRCRSYSTADERAELRRLRVASKRATWQAHAMAWGRLLGYLSDEQSRALVDKGFFDVRPPRPRYRDFYRLYALPGSHNITGVLCRGDVPHAIEHICFEPHPSSHYRAFTLLTQAMTLATDEQGARFVANISRTDLYLLSQVPQVRSHGIWKIPDHLAAAHYGKGYDDFIH